MSVSLDTINNFCKEIRKKNPISQKTDILDTELNLRIPSALSPKDRLGYPPSQLPCHIKFGASNLYFLSTDQASKKFAINLIKPIRQLG